VGSVFYLATSKGRTLVARNVTSLLLLGILLAAQAAPLAASGRRCGMERHARVALCGSCDIAGPPNRATTVSAASCCRFEAASPRSVMPGVVPSIQAAQDSGTAAAFALCRVAPGEATYLSEPACTSSPPLRSGDTPVAQNTTLRL
jgi:hypothetical protein